MKKIIIISLILLVFLLLGSIKIVDARSGCCSWHGGVCGCSCCDGSPLSSTCLPYYPGCSGYSSPSYTKSTPDCPSMSSYDSLSGSCKCYSGYIVDTDYSGNQSCVSGSLYCSRLYGYNSSYDSLSGNCKCMSGYVWGTDILGKSHCVTGDSKCQDKYGYGSKYDSLSDSCKCKYGYLWATDMSKCIDDDQYCRDKHGLHSSYDSLSDSCECDSRYEMTRKSYGSGLECVSCTSKYGINSEYDYLSDKCRCRSGYTLDDNSTCVKKQNNVYFLLKELKTDTNQAIIKSEYDYNSYLIEYGYSCYDSTMKRYLNNKIVVNLGTDFDLDRWDKIVLYNDSGNCDIKNVKKVSSSFTLEDDEEKEENFDKLYSEYLEQINTINNTAPNIPNNLENKDVKNNETEKTIINEIKTCNEGYSLFNNQCIKIPENAHVVDSPTDVWLCDEGYEEKNNSCVLIKNIEESVIKVTPIEKKDDTVDNLIVENNDQDDINNELANPPRGNKIKFFFKNFFNKISSWFK